MSITCRNILITVPIQQFMIWKPSKVLYTVSSSISTDKLITIGVSVVGLALKNQALFYTQRIVTFMIVKQHTEPTFKYLSWYQSNVVNVKIKESQANGVEIFRSSTIFYCVYVVRKEVCGTVFMQFAGHSVRPVITKLPPLGSIRLCGPFGQGRIGLAS